MANMNSVYKWCLKVALEWHGCNIYEQSIKYSTIIIWKVQMGSICFSYPTRGISPTSYETAVGIDGLFYNFYYFKRWKDQINPLKLTKTIWLHPKKCFSYFNKTVNESIVGRLFMGVLNIDDGYPLIWMRLPTFVFLFCYKRFFISWMKTGLSIPVI